VDKAKEKIALSLKHKSPSPWEESSESIPSAPKHTGESGQRHELRGFVQAEPGIEGWCTSANGAGPSAATIPARWSIGDQIEVQVLNFNKDKQEISLGIKQVQPNPWDKVAERYPPGVMIEGVVRQPDQLWRPSSRSSKASTASCMSAT